MNRALLSEILESLQDSQILTTFRLIDRSREDEKRYIYVVQTASNQQFVIKCYCNHYNEARKVNGWARLAKLYKQHGVNVPEFLPFSSGEHAVSIAFENESFLVWVEDYLDLSSLDDIDPNFSMDETLLKALGFTLGKMHHATQKGILSFDWNSPWVLFDTFCLDDEFDENYLNAFSLYTELSLFPIDHDLLGQIWSTYLQKRKQIQHQYELLPSGAVQGDLSTNNILLNSDHELSGIIDFNIAGNDVYVNHVMQEGIFLAFASEDFWNTSAETKQMQRKFNQFLQGYTENYQMNGLELEKMDLLYQIIRPFRMEKVYPTIRMAKEGQFVEVNKRLEWIKTEMEQTYE